jgi:hypothetical protein
VLEVPGGWCQKFGITAGGNAQVKGIEGIAVR